MISPSEWRAERQSTQRVIVYSIRCRPYLFRQENDRSGIIGIIVTEVDAGDNVSHDLVHAGLGHFEQGKDLFDYDSDDLLWFRPELTTRYDDATTVVFGHTPVASFGSEYEDKMLKTKTWINKQISYERA